MFYIFSILFLIKSSLFSRFKKTDFNKPGSITEYNPLCVVSVKSDTGVENTFCFKYLHKKKSSEVKSGDLGAHSIKPLLTINLPMEFSFAIGNGSVLTSIGF